MNAFYRVLSEHDFGVFQPMAIRSASEKKEYQLIRSGNYRKVLSRELSRQDYLRFGGGLHFFSARALSTITKIVPNVLSFPVTLSYREDSETYYVVEMVAKVPKLEPNETAGHYDLNSHCLRPDILDGVEILTFPGSNEVIVSEKLKNACVEAAVSGIFFEKLEMTNVDSRGVPFNCYEMAYGRASKYLWLKPEIGTDIRKENGHWKIEENAKFTRYSGTAFPDLACSTLAEYFYSEALAEAIVGSSQLDFDIHKISVSYDRVVRPYYQLVPKRFLQVHDRPLPGLNLQVGDRHSSRYFQVRESLDEFPAGLEGAGYLVLSSKEKDRIEAMGFSNVLFRKFKLVKAGDV